MKTVILGRSGLAVSQVGFGGIPIIPLAMEKAVEVVRHCYARGITFFDTANMYGNSEKMIGMALEKVRDKVVLATKTTRRDEKGAEEHIAWSLANLRTDVIDLYQFHNVSTEKDLDKILAPDGAMQAVQAAVAAGRIKQVGVISHKIDTAVKACRTGLFATLQFPFNFIEVEPLETLFQVAREQNMGIIAMKPLGGGLLDSAALCFKFLQQHPDVVPIPGISRPEEMDEILDLYRSPAPFTPEEKARLEQIRDELGQKFCHRCGYCLPCEQGIAIPEVLMFRSTIKRIPPVVAAKLAGAAMAAVENCSRCGECMQRCPYDLNIPDLLVEVKGLYDAVAG